MRVLALFLVSIAALVNQVNAAVGIIPFCSDNGGTQPCVPALDGRAGCPQVALTIPGAFATEALKSCGIANSAAELTVVGNLAGAAAKNKFFDLVCRNDPTPALPPEPNACAINLANMGLVFHSCRCAASDIICQYIARKLYVDMQPLAKSCSMDDLGAAACRADSCTNVAKDFADQGCGTYACPAPAPAPGGAVCPADSAFMTLPALTTCGVTNPMSLVPAMSDPGQLVSIVCAGNPQRACPQQLDAFAQQMRGCECAPGTAICGIVKGIVTGAFATSDCQSIRDDLKGAGCNTGAMDKCAGAAPPPAPTKTPTAPPTATVHNVGGSSARWSFGSYDDLAIAPGESVKFTFTRSHDVWRFKDKAAYDACSFSGATELAGRGDSPLTHAFPEDGTYYLGCRVGSHCRSGGMKVKVVVGDGGSVDVPPAPADLAVRCPCASAKCIEACLPAETCDVADPKIDVDCFGYAPCLVLQAGPGFVACPTAAPTDPPSTDFPTRRPTKFPTDYPTAKPTNTKEPVTAPTRRPTRGPTKFPVRTTRKPTEFPSRRPTMRRITKEPTKYPVRTTRKPTEFPSPAPRTQFPSSKPRVTREPTKYPVRTTRKPTKYPSPAPRTQFPSPAPRTLFPSAKRTKFPTRRASKYPTGFPTAGCPAGCVREGAKDEDGWSGDGGWAGDGEPMLRGRRLETPSGDAAALRGEVERLKAENARQCARIEELEQAARA